MRSVLAFCVLLTAVAACLADPPAWREAPEVYEVNRDGLTASDGGGSTGDNYLLTLAEYSDFVLSFDLTRMEAGGDKLRAIVVWGLDLADRSNRACFFLPVTRLGVGDTGHFEVIKLGARAMLKLEGNVVSREAAAYGEPLEKAPVAFLHYYNYHFRYTNVDLASLEADKLPPPTDLRAQVSPAGVVVLAWEVPEVYQGLAGFEVRRREGGAEAAGSAARAAPGQGEEASVVAETEGLEARDVTARSAVSYSYSVAAVLDDRSGPRSEEISVRVDRARPPRPVEDARAMLRIDGSARLSWRLAEDSRCAGLGVQRGEEVLAKGLDPRTNSFLAPPSEQREYVISTLDPDGRQDAVTQVRAEPAAPLVAEGASWPTRHPYLRYSAEDIDRARRLVRADGTARKVLASVCTKADGIISKPPDIPRERSDEHRKMTGPVRRVADAYALSGDDRYAAWVREVMLAYAKLYPTLEPFSGGRARIVKTGSGLYEATWYVPVICAYDMTYDSPVYSAEDHQRIADDFLRPAAELFWVKDYTNSGDHRARDLHYKCYNFQAWFISAVGLTGMLLRDADMVEHAIDGPYGFKHLLAHDVHDDGLFWERSLGYHSFVLSALLPFLEAAYHCNLDLYHLRVPDDYNEDREPLANYTVGDGDNGPKSIKLMFDGPFYALYGNRTYANVGDSNAGPLRAGEYYRVAYHRYREPKYAWLYWQDRKRSEREELYRGETDLSGTVRVAYDDTALYIGAEITDDVVRNTHAKPGEVWAGDALWVGLKWRAQEGGGYDFIYGLSPGDFAQVPPVPALFNRFQETNNGASSGEYAVKKTENGYSLEIAVPWAEFEPGEGEEGTAFRPQPGAQITVDCVLYDGDPSGGASTKEKMLGWSCTIDRYDSAQGGALVFDDTPPEGEGIINAPRAEGLVVDGELDDWAKLPARPARIGTDSAVMTDAGSGPDLLSLIYDAPVEDEAQFDYLGGSFCNNGILQAGCTLYPSTGFAILREGLDESGLPPPDATCCTLNYGPHGGGHGHPDQLSIVLYADGKQWIPDFGSCPYGSKEKQTWTSQTISHNTVVVDEVSQYPTVSGTPSWPCDAAERQARGFLDFFDCDAAFKAAGARNSAVYEGVTVRRTVALVGDALVDFFEAESAAEHQYDYPLHIDGPLLACSALLAAQEGVLADKPGYQHNEAVRRGVTDEPVVTTWGDEARKLRISCAPAPGTEVIVAEGITNKLDRKMPMLILRRRAEDTIFATVMQPFTTDESQSPEWLREGEAVAVRLVVPEGTALVVYNPSEGVVEVDGLRVAGRLALRLTRADGTVVTRQL